MKKVMLTTRISKTASNILVKAKMKGRSKESVIDEAIKKYGLTIARKTKP